jgi:predicted Rossmann fold nucleotide-binding protein DprA/Smf involved in DNA uptake
VPGPVTAGPSTGTNELIANGAALIRDGSDILDRLLGAGLRLPEPLFGPDLVPGELRVLETVEAGETSIDTICAAAGLDAAGTAGCLARLEIAGYISCSLTGQYRRTGLAEPGAYALRHE